MNTLFPTTLNLTLMQQRRAGGTTQSTAQPSVSYLKNYDNVVGVLCCYKAVSVLEQSHARQFARYSSDFHKKRLWVGELKMLEQLTLSLSLSLSCHGTSAGHSHCPADANIEICVELARCCQGWWRAVRDIDTSLSLLCSLLCSE